MESIFKFDKVYSRLLKEDEFFEIEFLFCGKYSKNIAIFHFGNFYIVNKGETFDVGDFEELKISGLSGKEVDVLEICRKKQDVYMSLEQGVIKIAQQFNITYGCKTNFLIFSNKSFCMQTFNQIQEEMKQAIKQDIIDYRFL